MRRITLFIVSFVIWFLLAWPYNFQTGTMNWQMFVVGIVFSLVAALLFVEVFTRTPLKLFSPKRYFWFLCYLPLFFYYMLVANLDVVYRVIHPRMPIKPGIVKVRTKLQSESAKAALANSITLTPGTLTVDITDDGYLYVHWIYVRDTDIEKATQRIVSRFERFLIKIFD
ncbi:MAG TPA: Na+/H+ antiporter subunit E [Spirochaetia bacterium]|nr:Na+/H+ antiporter subunit E [Spirochaetia bacterium]